MEYLERHWQPNWKSVLEVGTGRLIPFFKERHVSHYLGFDTSREMLNHALKRILPEGFDLVMGDLLTSSLNEDFDLFVYAFNTANYILDLAELEEHLHLCASHMKRGSSIFLDLYVPFAISKNEDGTASRLRESVEIGDSVYELRDRRTYDPLAKIERRNQTGLMISGGQLRAEINFQTERRYFLLEEIQALSAHLGLSITSTDEYGQGYVEGIYIFIS
jgi:hypothetical protein